MRQVQKRKKFLWSIRFYSLVFVNLILIALFSFAVYSLYAKNMILPNQRFGIQKNFHSENPDRLVYEAGKMTEELERKSHTVI